MLPPILLAGPTASGKSALAMALAEEVDGVVINADALQVYDCWRVLSARPSPEDEARVSHALYGHVPALRAHSVGDWLREVAPYLAGARRAVICGGTGLYFTALTQGLAEIPPIPDEVRQAADAIRTGAGPERFRTDLAAQDPVTLAGLDARNPMRLQRAWEVLRATGRGLAAWQADTPPPLLPLDHSVPLVLETPVGWLDARIAHRFAAMLDAGAEDEVAAWEASRLPAHLPAAQAIGRAEISAMRAGEMTRAQAEAAATLATRRYAKRQRTWMRSRFKAWHHLDASAEPGALLSAARAVIRAAASAGGAT